MKVLHLLTSTLLSSFLLPSCATIVHGSRQEIYLSTTPFHAKVWIDQAYRGQSPLLVNLSRRDHHSVRIELAGYQPYEMIIHRTLSGWVFGNILFGGIIGVAVDAISGGMYRLTPEHIEMPLQENKSLYSTNIGLSMTIVSGNDPRWEKMGQLVPLP